MNWGVALMERDRVVVSTRRPRESQRVDLRRWSKVSKGVKRTLAGEGDRGKGKGRPCEDGGERYFALFVCHFLGHFV